jgi:hypothetical protein
MLVELGNPSPKNVAHTDPCVTYINIPDEKTFDPDVDLAELKAHIEAAFSPFAEAEKAGVTHRPTDEALLTIVSPSGVWAAHSKAAPSWVVADKPEFAAALAAWYGCPVGKPDDVEDTHWTNSGPPGVNRSPGPTALVVNSGNDILSKQIGGAGIYTTPRTSTGTSATSLTDTGASFSTSLVGQIVLAGTVYGVIESATSTVLTIDRWYNPATPGGAAGSTPGATTAYVVLPGCAPALFMALSSSNSSPASGDTTMASEITTASGGLVRAIGTYAHTASATTYTLANTWTANGSDSLPVTIYRSGTFISMVNGWSGSMLSEDTLNASATITASGDQLTLTWTATV